jgi:peroxiredoxin
MSKETLESNTDTRKFNPKSFLLVLLVILGSAVILLLQTKDGNLNLTGKAILGKGAAAPNFTLPDLNGNMVNLTDYRGKVVLLNIWATWCPPCVEEMPSMERLYQTMKGEDFVLLAVSIDNLGAEAVIPFMKKYNLNFTVLTDPKGTIKYRYQTTGVPESYIIDKNGMIADKVLGAKDWSAPEAVRFLRGLAQAK